MPQEIERARSLGIGIFVPNHRPYQTAKKFQINAMPNSGINVHPVAVIPKPPIRESMDTGMARTMDSGTDKILEWSLSASRVVKKHGRRRRARVIQTVFSSFSSNEKSVCRIFAAVRCRPTHKIQSNGWRPAESPETAGFFRQRTEAGTRC